MNLGTLWKRFEDLTAQPPKQLADVVSRDGQTYTVKFKSGGMADVVSDAAYAEGQSVFVRDGRIVSEAPALEYAEFEV